MKILHIINHMGMGGAQSLLAELAPVQKTMGHDVTVLELVSTKDRTLVEKLNNAGVEVQTVSHVRSVRNPLNVFSLIPYLKKYDIAHVHLFPSTYWTSLAKMLSISVIPVVTTEHSTTNKRRSIPIFKYIDKFFYKRYCQVISCSDKALDTFRARFQGVRCCSIPNGVDISRYQQALPYPKLELLDIPEEDIMITMVARFDYPKRQDTLVQAVALLPDNYHAVFVGGSPGDEGVKKIRSLAEDCRVTHKTHFMYIRSDVPRILKTSDVVLMSSEYEGLSLSSIEGMACGRPVIATDVNGLREVIGGAGVLFECGNAQELACRITELTGNEKYRDSIIRKCLERASEYDIRSVAEKYQKEYEKFI